YGGNNLASAADLRSGEIRVIFFSISVVSGGDNYTDREGGFYAHYSRIFIRGVKENYNNIYSYVLRRDTNSIYLNKITIAERDYGELIADNEAPEGSNPYYQSVCHEHCTYEQVKFGSTVSMRGWGYSQKYYYAEEVKGILFRTLSGDHYDLSIDGPSWLAGVGDQGDFKGLKGRSFIVQGAQNDHEIPFRSRLKFDTCEATVYLQSYMTDYKDFDNSDFGINVSSNSYIRMQTLRRFKGGAPILTDLGNNSVPIILSGKTATSLDSVIGAKKISYNKNDKNLIFTTDILFEEGNNFIIITVNIDDKKNNKSHPCIGIILNGFWVSGSGLKCSSNQDGIYTAISIDFSGIDDSWLIDDNYLAHGIIRII
ncbi:hypothetical protein, partial [Xenorhabdus bovienii]|uniref:hypothetical protein n=1 Tax=Xenorhabdus bovienii TaxID=40576 RepID=UPI0023B23662